MSAVSVLSPNTNNQLVWYCPANRSFNPPGTHLLRVAVSPRVRMHWMLFEYFMVLSALSLYAERASHAPLPIVMRTQIV